MICNNYVVQNKTSLFNVLLFMIFGTPKYNKCDVNTFNILCMTIICFFPSGGERSCKTQLATVIEMCYQNEEQRNKVK